MSVRQYAAMFFGTLVIALGLSLVPAHADWKGQPDEDSAYIEEMMNRAEVEPDLTEFYEADDMPSYLALDRPEAEVLVAYADAPDHAAEQVTTDASVLAADGPGGLRWSILGRLALLSVLFGAVAIYGKRSYA